MKATKSKIRIYIIWKASKHLYCCVYFFKSIKESILFHLFFKCIKESFYLFLEAIKKYCYFIYLFRSNKEFILFCNLFEAIKNNYICFIVFWKYETFFVLFHLSFENNKNRYSYSGSCLFLKKYYNCVSSKQKIWKFWAIKNWRSFIFWRIFLVLEASENLCYFICFFERIKHKKSFKRIIKFTLFHLFFWKHK